MSKKSVKKILIVLLALFTFLILNINSSVNATSMEQKDVLLNEKEDSEEKIMKYSAVTGETTEVDIETLKEKVVSLINADGSISLKPYTQKGTNYIPKIFAPSTRQATFSKITDITSFNSLTSCKIICDQGTASASIVGPKVALTAAHCIWNSSTKQKYTNLKFYPAYNNGHAYDGLSCGWSEVYYSKKWMEDSSPYVEYDWAICLLEKPLGTQTGAYLGATSYSILTSQKGQKVDLYGYPSTLDSGKNLYKMSSSIDAQNTTTYQYEGAGGVGFSGGPVIRLRYWGRDCCSSWSNGHGIGRVQDNI